MNVVKHPAVYTPPPAGGPLAPGGEPPHDGGMDDLYRRVGALEGHVGGLRTDVAAIKERLNHMPTKHDLWKALWASAAVPILGLIAWIVKELVLPFLQH